MIYKANFYVNNGTRLASDITGTNKRKVAKDIIACAKGERFEGSEATWSINDESGYTIAYGMIDKNGRNHNIIK